MAILLSFLPQEQGIAIGKIATELNYIDSQLPINLKSTNLTNNTTVETNTSGNTFLTFTDMENTPIGQIESRFFPSGTQTMRIFSNRKMEDGTFKDSGFFLSIDSNGEPAVAFLGNRTKEAWHTALRPDVLFNGHSNGTITLSASAANYSHMKIFYSTALYNSSTLLNGSICIYQPNGKNANLFFGEVYSSGSNRMPLWKGKDITINGTQITTRTTNRYYTTTNSTTTARTTAATNVIYIDRVEAW